MWNLKFAHKPRLAGWEACHILLVQRAVMGWVIQQPPPVPAAPALQHCWGWAG